MDIWILVAGVEFGPYSEQKVREHLAEGLAAMSDSARSSLTEDWTTLGELLSRTPTAIPVPEKILPPARKSMAVSKPLPKPPLPDPPPQNTIPPGSEITIPNAESTDPEPTAASSPKPLHAPLAPFHFGPDTQNTVTIPLFQVPRMPIAPSAKAVAKRKPIVLSGQLGLSPAASPQPSDTPKENVAGAFNLSPPEQPLSSPPKNKSTALSLAPPSPPISATESIDSSPSPSDSSTPPPFPVVSALRPASSPLPPPPKSLSSFLPPIRVPLSAPLPPPPTPSSLNPPPDAEQLTTSPLRFEPEASPKMLKSLAPADLSKDPSSTITLGMSSKKESPNIRKPKHPDSLKSRPVAEAKTPLRSEKPSPKLEATPTVTGHAAKKARPPAPVELTGVRRTSRIPRFLLAAVVLAYLVMAILWMVHRPLNIRPVVRPKEIKVVPPPRIIDASILQNHLDEGEALLRKEDWSGALLEYNAAIDIDPESSTAYYGRGRTKTAQNEWDGAIADFTQALQLNSKLAEAWYHRGFVRQKRGDLDGALADYTQAIQETPPIPLAFYHRGLIEEQQGDLDGALKDITRALELDPKNAQAFYNRGLCRLGKGDLDGALTDLNHFCEITAKDSYLDYAQLYLFIIRSQQNQAAEANRQLSDNLIHGWNSSGDDLVSKIAQYLLGQITDADLIGATAASDVLKDQQQRCEAFYFIGAKRQLAGDHNGAEEAYQKGVSTQEKDFCEFILAREALHGLGVTPPALLPPTVGP